MALHDDERILEAIGSALEGEGVEHSDATAGDAALHRDYIEILGLLPYELEPRGPSPECRTSVLARALMADSEGAVLPFRPPEASPEPRPLPRYRQFLTPGVRRGLAAGLGAVTIGLTFATASLVSTLNESEATIDQLRSELSASQNREAEWLTERDQWRTARDQLGLVTSRGVGVCPLQPVGRAPRQASGLLFVAQDQQHWYLKVHGLKPDPEGAVYQLWFLVDGQPVSGGTLRFLSEETGELADNAMPSGTSAVVITLESQGGGPEPQGPRVLFGDDMVDL